MGKLSSVWKTSCLWHWTKAREYRSQFHIGVSWGIHQTTVGRIVRKVEDLLIKCGKFRLPSQRQLYQPGWEWKVMLVDVGEMEIERPKKNRNATESGKQKCHTLKAQLLVEFESKQVVCTAVDTGKTHDFKLLGRSRLPLVSSQLCLADRGYQGFAKLHTGACTPTNKPRKQPLSKEERQHNQALARLRVRVEHVIRRFKIFRIFAGRYRNRRKRFGLRLNLIAGLLNYELAHPS